MPRKSAASLTVAAINRARPPRLPAPPHLTAAQAAIWKATVCALPSDYFPPEIAPTLERYCVHFSRAREIEKMLLAADLTKADGSAYFAFLAKLARAESAAMGAAARALRLTNQSRRATTAQTAASRHAATRDACRPWAKRGDPDWLDPELIAGINDDTPTP